MTVEDNLDIKSRYTPPDINTHLSSTTSLTEPDPLKADFRNFMFVVWKHLGLPDPTILQYDIAEYLQNGPRRLMVQAFRGVGKSWMTVAFVLWCLYKDQNLKILVVSASAPKANEFSSMVKSLIFDMPLLAFLRPRPDQRQSMIAFDVGPARPDIAPSVKSVGITGQVTGSRADIIVPDDIEVPRNSDTQTKRDALITAVKEFDAVLKPGGRILWLGTPQTEQSIYNELPSKGYTIRIWPAQFPSDPESDPSKKLDPIEFAEKKYGGKLAPYIYNKMLAAQKAGTLNELVGTSTDPVRFSDEDLAERRLSYGRAGFDLQFQLDTSLSDASRFPLKLRDLIVHPLDVHRAPSSLVWASSPELACGDDVPMVGMSGDRYYRAAWWSNEYLEYAETIMFVDPSGKGQDETAYAVLKFLHGYIFLVASGGYLSGYGEDTLKGLLMVARKWGVNKILTEPNYGGGMFTQLLRAAAQQWYPVTIEDAEWQTTQKEVRIIDTLEPVLSQHKLVVGLDVIKEDYASTEGYSGERAVVENRLFYQLTRMSKEKDCLNRNDRIDALAGGVAYFLPYMSTNSEAAHLRAKEDVITAELERFMSGLVFGRNEGGSGDNLPLPRGGRTKLSSTQMSSRPRVINTTVH